jgi:hypothetical protein
MAPKKPGAQRTRGLSLVLGCLGLVGVCYGLFLVLRPIHWRLHAEFTHGFGHGLRLPGELDSNRTWSSKQQ